MKLRYDLIPADALKEVARVLALGEEKHKGNNFRDVHLEHNQHIASAFRHGEAYRGGERVDPEMGTHHLAHRIVRDLYQLQIDMEELSELYESEKVISTWGKSATLRTEEEIKAKQWQLQAKAMTPYEAGPLSLSNEVGDGDA